MRAMSTVVLVVFLAATYGVADGHVLVSVVNNHNWSLRAKDVILSCKLLQLVLCILPWISCQEVLQLTQQSHCSSVVRQ